MKKLYEPLTDTTKDTSKLLTKTMTEHSMKKNKAISDLNNKVFEIIIDRAILASYLLSLLSKKTNPEQTIQFKLLQDLGSKRVKDLFINKTKPVSQNKNLLTFRDTDNKLELQGDLSEMITNKNYNVDLPNLPDKKLKYEFGKEFISIKKI